MIGCQGRRARVLEGAVRVPGSEEKIGADSDRGSDDVGFLHPSTVSAPEYGFCTEYADVLVNGRLVLKIAGSTHRRPAINHVSGSGQLSPMFFEGSIGTADWRLSRIHSSSEPDYFALLCHYFSSLCQLTPPVRYNRGRLTADSVVSSFVHPRDCSCSFWWRRLFNCFTHLGYEFHARSRI